MPAASAPISGWNDCKYHKTEILVTILITLLISPFLVFHKDNYKKLRNNNFKLIFNSIFFSLTYFVILNINTNPMIILMILYFSLQNEKIFDRLMNYSHLRLFHNLRGGSFHL